MGLLLPEPRRKGRREKGEDREGGEEGEEESKEGEEGEGRERRGRGGRGGRGGSPEAAGELGKTLYTCPSLSLFLCVHNPHLGHLG